MHIKTIKLPGAGNIIRKNITSKIPWHDYRDFKINDDYYKNILTQINLTSKTNKLCLISGGIGGFLYINFANSLGLEKEFLDSIGIDVVKTINFISIGFLKSIGCNVCPTTVEVEDLSRENFKTYDVIFLNGSKDFISTDSVAAQAAKILESELIYFKNGIPFFYVGFPTPKEIKKYYIKDFIDNSVKYNGKSGNHYVLDLQALNIIKTYNIKTSLFNKKELINLNSIARNPNQDNSTKIVFNKQ